MLIIYFKPEKLHTGKKTKYNLNSISNVKYLIKRFLKHILGIRLTGKKIEQKTNFHSFSFFKFFERNFCFTQNPDLFSIKIISWMPVFSGLKNVENFQIPLKQGICTFD